MFRKLLSRAAINAATAKCNRAPNTLGYAAFRSNSTAETHQNAQETEQRSNTHLPLWLEDNLMLKVEEKSATETYIDVIKTEEDPDNSPVKPCILCRLDITNINYTDVVILSQFIKKNGQIKTYHESRLCSKQYLRVLKMISQAQRCNLIDRPADYLVPGPWHDLNTYIERDRRRDQPLKYIKPEYWKI